jgi:hypothetical protein
LGYDTEPEPEALQSIKPTATLKSTALRVSHQLEAIERHAPGNKLDGPRGALALLRSSDAFLQKSHFLQRLFVKGRHRKREGRKTRTNIPLLRQKLLFTATAADV